MATVLNAFQIAAAARVAARAPAAATPSPAAPPRPVQRGAHQLFHIRTPLRGLDVAGRPTLLQGARLGGPFVIEGSAAAQVSNDKRQALLRGSIGPRIVPQGPQTHSKTFQKPGAGACPTCVVQSAGALQSTE